MTGAFENNARRAGESFDRVTAILVLAVGAHRSTQLEFEPATGWHRRGDSTDASGLAFTRLRLFHYFGAGHRFSVGPDFEVFFKTEAQPSLGFGYARLMPGLVAAYRFHGAWRTVVRTRWEFSADENPGLSARSRLHLRPTLYYPPLGAWTFWTRGDAIADLKGAHGQYNVEGNATLRLGHEQRLAAYVQPRLYVGAASRVKNLYRLRAGLIWSLAR